jgi:hypothetical protein
MAVRLHKLEKEETEYHHLILVKENEDLLRETAAASEGVTSLEDLLQRSKSEQKTMLEQMESLRVELKMHKDIILPSQHQRMLELASRMHRLQECAATARSNDLMRQLQRKVIGYWESYNMSRQINTRTSCIFAIHRLRKNMQHCTNMAHERSAAQGRACTSAAQADGNDKDDQAQDAQCEGLEHL